MNIDQPYPKHKLFWSTASCNKYAHLISQKHFISQKNWVLIVLDISIQNALVLRVIGMFNISVKISLMGNMLVNLLVSSPQPKCWWKQSNNEQKINLLLIFYCAHISNNLFMKKCCVRLVNPSWCNLWGYMCCALYWNGCTFLFLFFFSG